VNKQDEVKWFNLVLVGGFQSLYETRYMKDNLGWVQVIGTIRKETPPVPSERFAQLPEGFAPAIMTPFLLSQGVSSNGNSWSTYGYIHTDGSIAFHGGAQPNSFNNNQGLAFNVIFIAAQ